MDKAKRALLSGVLWVGILFLAAALLPPAWPTAAGLSTLVPAAIASDTTWTLAGSPYLVASDVTVNPGVTLSIEAGVQVRFDGNYSLAVRGTLKAAGLAGQPVLFTSNQASPAPGDWGALDLRADSQHSRLEHVILEYGGSSGKAGWYCAAGMLCANTSSFWLEASTLRRSATRGLVLAQSGATVYQTAFTNNALEAIRLQACDLAKGECHPKLIDNRFTGNKYPVLLDNAQLPELSGNTASGNEINGLVLNPTCNLKGANTFYAGDLPYVVIASGSWCLIGPYNTPTRLTVQPGTVFKLQNSLKLQYNTVITATGTAEAPIIFTSLKDDSVGGDTNNDGAASSPAPEDWGAIVHEGAGVQASYTHVIWRYGGGTAFGWGPLVAAQGGARVSIRDSELTQAEVGAYAYDTARLDLQTSSLHHLLTAGVDTYSSGAVLLAGNRFTSIGASAVAVQNGAPLIRDNFFQGSPKGVEVICSTAACNPVVSPHNRFIGAEQTGVYVRYPASVCVDARRNAWGDPSGPADSSTAADACLAADNPGQGAQVSDGVNYSPWEGGLGRPVLAEPLCGVTANSQPLFNGRAPAGALVSLYDSGVKIGETTAAGDDRFAWTPGAALGEGAHSLSASAELGGQTSLPSPALALVVDSGLPYDPQGVRILYNFHGVLYSQALRDAQGCASPAASLQTPVWVRPGTLMTVSVPVRSAALSSAADSLPAGLAGAPGRFSQAGGLAGYTPQREVPVQNNSSERIVGYRVASSQYNPDNRIYSGYGEVQAIPGGIPGGMPGTISVNGDADVMLVTEDGALFRADGHLGDPGYGGISVPAGSRPAQVTVHNRTGYSLFPVYFGRPEASGHDYYGGSNLAQGVPPGADEPVGLPASASSDAEYAALALGTSGFKTVFYPLIVQVPAGRDAELTVEGGYGEVDLSNGFPGDICDFGLAPYEDQPPAAGRKPLNLLQYLDPNGVPSKLAAGASLPRIQVGAGKYYWQAYFCDGTPAGHGVVEISEVHRDNMALQLKLECQDKVRIGPYDYPLKRKARLSPQEASAAFDTYQAVFPMSAGPLSFQICRGGYTCSQPLGLVLIDPDGYVYDAAGGPGAVIQGATVICRVYDEDYRAWYRWPAELFESQVNPQVTGADGYYAFFVPPGRYRIEASAPGYAPHTSPDLQVVEAVVHYNVPLTQNTWRLFLPALKK